MKLKILVIEDDKDIQDVLYNYLIDAKYNVVITRDGEEGLKKFDDSFHLVLLDIMLPKINGFEVCENIRNSSNVPIIMLTALSDEGNEIKGYKHQADDYIAKPFSPKVLLHKIDRILQRCYQTTEEESLQISYQDLTMNVEGRHVYVYDTELFLTPKEFDILCVLLCNKGMVFTRQMILDSVWKENDYVEDRVVDSHMKNLRKKLGEEYIKTIRGVGYRIDK